jgi:hypothetical protein
MRGLHIEDLSPTVVAFLEDAPLPVGYDDWQLFLLKDLWGDRGDTRGLWNRYGTAIVEQWAEEQPGRRPMLWWAYDAPRWRTYDLRHADCWYVTRGEICEPRERLGGIGTPVHEVLNYGPAWTYGIPDRWVTVSDVACYGPKFRGVAIDPSDPPRYESQAAYLQRHGLLLPGEAARLRAPDFAPELVAPAADLCLDDFWSPDSAARSISARGHAGGLPDASAVPMAARASGGAGVDEGPMIGGEG